MARFEPAPDLPRQVALATVEGRANVARLAAANARAVAPVVTGAYRGGIGVTVNRGSGEVTLVDTDPLAHLKEFGTVDTPAHMTLTNAARRYGRLVGTVAGGPVGGKSGRPW